MLRLPTLSPCPHPGAAFTCLETAFRLDALHRQMKLLGEDSPVSKLQVKLEPGTYSHQASPQALQTSHCRALPCHPLLPLARVSLAKSLPRPGQVPPALGRPPLGSLSLLPSLLGSEH